MADFENCFHSRGFGGGMAVDTILKNELFDPTIGSEWRFLKIVSTGLAFAGLQWLFGESMIVDILIEKGDI